MKKIGIDITPLQGPHRMRGIGYVTQHIINNLPQDRLSGIEIVLYFNKDLDLKIEDAVKNLNIQNIKFSFREIPSVHKNIFVKNLHGRLALIPKAFTKLGTYLQYRFGTNTFGNTKDIDIFIQFDQSAPLPRRIRGRGTSLLVLYDIIPYKLESDYLWSYKTARRQGLNRRGAIKCSIRRSLYKHHLIANTRHAGKLISISNATSNDFVKYLRVKREKIELITLGVDSHQNPKKHSEKTVTIARYHHTSWGYLPREYTLSSSVKFLFFVGGADRRRKLEDLVAAFNQLRARGEEILLVLAGDSMQGPNSISNEAVRKSLLETAYPDDIVYIGFTDDKTRDWLYKHATALVFPSVYEGFGLPVLEAMSYGTPVISYDNLATKEVALDGPLYAYDTSSLINQIHRVLDMSEVEKRGMLKNSVAITKRYTWESAGKKFLSIVEKL